ncbi:MAG: GGDEF domain-containing protein [Thermoanaerobaculia bacterium]
MLDLLASFPELRSLGIEEPVEAGRLLWREGDPGDEVVVLLEGTLDVVHETEGECVLLRKLFKGALLGEIAALDGRGRSASVRAVTACRILRIGAAPLRDLLQVRPDLYDEFFRVQADRVRSLTGQVTRSHRRAITDTLTQIYNYGFFRERLGIELERASLSGDPLALLIFDIDHFKSYNDAHGHPCGNEALRTVAAILKSLGRRGEIVARFGGEEFVALLYGASHEEAVRFAEGFRARIEANDFAGGETQPQGRLTISGGVACFPADAGGEDALIIAADANLYLAKKEGRNRIVPAA